MSSHTRHEFLWNNASRNLLSFREKEEIVGVAMKASLVLIGFFLVQPLSIAQSKEASAVQSAISNQLRVCHQFHLALLHQVDRMPWKSPVDAAAQMPDAASTVQSCREEAKDQIDLWQRLGERAQDQQEKGMTQLLGFPFDKVIEDLNFFTVLGSHLKKP